MAHLSRSVGSRPEGCQAEEKRGDGAAPIPLKVSYVPPSQTVRSLKLIPMLLNELQHEHQEVSALHKELAELAPS